MPTLGRVTNERTAAAASDVRKSRATLSTVSTVAAASAASTAAASAASVGGKPYAFQEPALPVHIHRRLSLQFSWLLDHIVTNRNQHTHTHTHKH